MKRRDFIRTALVPAFFSGGALAFNRIGKDVSGFHDAQLAWVFFDDRFDASVSLMETLPFSGKKVSVRGDVTSIWNSEIRNSASNASVKLEGISTESCYFCLQNLLQKSHTLTTSIQRVDRDLYAWSISAIHKNDNRKTT